MLPMPNSRALGGRQTRQELLSRAVKAGFGSELTMRIYFGFAASALLLGLLLVPSVRISDSMASAPSAAVASPGQQGEAGQVTPAVATFTVNSTADTPDAIPGNGVCNDGMGACTLRAAIMEANALAGADTINFDISPAGPKTLMFGSPLPPIIDTLTINGTTQGGFSGTPIIELRGMGVIPPLLIVQASNSTIRGLVVNSVDGNAIALLGNNNKVVGSFIGTDLTGTVAGPGNVGAGVAVSGSGNAIGGTAAGAPNIIAFNGTGVSVIGGIANSILSNSISRNTVLGIDLNGDGVTPNDGCDVDNGSNGLQNFPILTGAQSTGTIVSVQGTLNSKAGTTYRIEFFANANCHPSTFGEGEKFIGSTTVTTDGGCNATFNVNFAFPVPAGQFVTGTATEGVNDTSEFSQCVLVTATTCTINCPGNIARSNDLNQCGAVVNYPAPTTGGACGAVTCTPATGTFFPAGTTVVTCTTGAGPSCSFNITVNDTQAPTITCPANVTRSTDPNRCSAVVTYPAPMANDNCPGVTASCNPPSGSSFTKGATTVNCTATDTSGNTANCSFMVTVNDTQAPTITCPSNVMTTTSNPGGTAVNYPPPAASDNCPGVTANCMPPSGSNFPVGMTVVTCTATDTAANTANCMFTVTVTLVPCTITCPANVARLNDANQCGAVVTYPDAIPNGACGAVTCSPGKGAFFPVGSTVVTCTAVGGPSCQFNVTVVDNTPPRVTCPAPITIALPPGQSSTRVTYTDATVTDNCPGTSVQCSPPSGSIFPAGTTFVTCVGTDPSSNSATCLFGVTVLDAEAPVVRCPANVTVDVPSTQCSAVANYPAATVTDNVSGAIVACAPPSGSTFSVGVTTVTCTATDVAGNRATCAFSVTLTGGTIQAVISPASVDLKAANVLSSKDKKRIKFGEFSILNGGCGVLGLVFKPPRRITDQSKFSNTDDSAFFSVFSRAPDGSPTGPNLIGQQVTIGPGVSNQRSFVVRFAPSIPKVTGKTTGLSASDVVPNSFQSMLSFDGTTATVTINAAVRPGVKLIDPVNPANPAVATLCRSGNQFIVRYWIYDSNKSDVKSAKYEFLDSAGNVITTIDNVDLAGPLSQSGLVNGQSFNVENAFTGANDNTNVVKVRVTVFGGNSSDTVTSDALQSSCGSATQLLWPAHQITLLLPVMKLDVQKP